MTSHQSRHKWHKTKKKGTWSITLGERGKRVSLFQIMKDKNFYLRHCRSGRKHRESLGTSDKAEAHRLAQLVLSKLLAGKAPQAPAVVHLGEIAKRFIGESATFLAATPKWRGDVRFRATLLCTVIGAHRSVSTIREEDVRRYEQVRLAGGIKYAGGKISPPVRARSAQADVKLLKQMLRWACTVTLPSGAVWLDRHPLQYLRVSAEKDPRRPVATVARYIATRDAMRSLQKNYADLVAPGRTKRFIARARRNQRSWISGEFGLWLLHRTGQRQGAIVRLKWADFDFATQKVTWRRETNKSGRGSTVPYPPEFFATVREFQERLGAKGEFVFPRERDPNRPVPNEMLYQKIMDAERLAGLPKLHFGGTHTYRRKFVSERPGVSRKALMEAGGWKDVGTLTRCYDQPDDSDLLLVTAHVTEEKTPSDAAQLQIV